MLKEKQRFKLLILALALACMVTAFFLRSAGPLYGEALNTLGVVVGVLLLLVFDVFPIPITCLLAVVCLLVFGCVDSVNQIFSGYSNHILYFTFASFGLTYALSNSSLAKRLLFVLIRISRKSSKSILLVLMVSNAILSSIVSNVAAVLLFIPVVMSFLQWMGVGIPACFAILLIAFFLLVMIFPPASLEEKDIIGFVNQFHFEKFSRDELYTLCVVLSAVVLWILSSWFPQIHITVVAIVALTVLFLPKYGVLSWEEFIHSMAWETFFIAGTMITLANCVVGSGLSEFILRLILPGEVQLPFTAVAALVAALTFVVMVIVPSAPASISILGPFVVNFALNNNYNPAVLVMICGICVSNCYLLPLDTPAMVIYSHRAFKMFDLPKVTLWLQCAVVAVMTFLVVPLCRLLNIG